MFSPALVHPGTAHPVTDRSLPVVETEAQGDFAFAEFLPDASEAIGQDPAAAVTLMPTLAAAPLYFGLLADAGPSGAMVNPSSSSEESEGTTATVTPIGGLTVRRETDPDAEATSDQREVPLGPTADTEGITGKGESPAHFRRMAPEAARVALRDAEADAGTILPTLAQSWEPGSPELAPAGREALSRPMGETVPRTTDRSELLRTRVPLHDMSPDPFRPDSAGVPILGTILAQAGASPQSGSILPDIGPALKSVLTIWTGGTLENSATRTTSGALLRPDGGANQVLPAVDPDPFGQSTKEVRLTRRADPSDPAGSASGEVLPVSSDPEGPIGAGTARAMGALPATTAPTAPQPMAPPTEPDRSLRDAIADPDHGATITTNPGAYVPMAGVVADSPRTLPPSLQPVTSSMVESLVRNPDGTATLTLSPEELGKVSLSFQADSQSPDCMVVMLTFDRVETMELFRRHADQLADSLRSAGYAGVQLGFGDSGAQGHQSGPDQPDALVHGGVDPAAQGNHDPLMGRIAGPGALNLRL